MYLTKEEEKILAGEAGSAPQKAMEILTVLGDVYDAKELIPAKSAHIAGVSYKTIRDAGLNFLQEVTTSQSKTAIPTTLNPAGMPLENWEALGIPEEFANKQLAIIKAYQDMGVSLSCTCTPYFVGNRPQQKDHVAWAESSAVVYANSILGARTNREGGPSALAAALIGKTPLYGLHLSKNRKGTVFIDLNKLDFRKMERVDYSLAGYHVGRVCGREIPVLSGMPRNVGQDHLRMFGGGAATSGGIGLFHVLGITPEAGSLGEIFDEEKPERISIDFSDIQSLKEEFSAGQEPDIFCVGCPHCSINEIKMFAGLFRNKKVAENKDFWICTAKQTKQLAEQKGYVKTIEEAGARIIIDTCMVVSPLEELGFNVMATNSAKAAHYVSSLTNLEVELLSIQECVEAALG